MPGALDAKLRDVALSLIERLGKTTTFTVVTAGGTYDPSDGTVVGRTTADCQVVATPPLGVKRGFERDATRPGDVGDVTEQAEARIVLAAKGLPFTPAPGTVAHVDGEEWVAVAARPIYSGELVAAWELTVARRQQ